MIAAAAVQKPRALRRGSRFILVISNGWTAHQLARNRAEVFSIHENPCLKSPLPEKQLGRVIRIPDTSIGMS